MHILLAVLVMLHGATSSTCISLSKYSSAEEAVPLQRCQEEHSAGCSASFMNISFLHEEVKDGERFEDTYPCYPLSDADLTRSRQAVKGDTSSMAGVAARARAGEDIKVVALGGSVTNGGGCGSAAFHQSSQGSFGTCSWTNRFVRVLRRKYSNENIKLVNMAQPATTSAWALSHFDRVLAASPDLVFVDYAVNDPIYFSDDAANHQHIRLMQAATERLIRRFNEFAETIQPDSKRPALVYVVTQRGWENSSFGFPNAVYHPVCQKYDVPVVSIKDSIWPNLSECRLELWPTVKGCHPVWLGHQLITDIMTYAWDAAVTAAAAAAAVSAAGPSSKTAAVGSYLASTRPLMRDTPFHFSPGQGASNAHTLGVCPQGYLSRTTTTTIGTTTSLTDDELKPSSVGAGWVWTDNNGKQGWEYDLSAQQEHDSSLNPAHRILVSQPNHRRYKPSSLLPTSAKALSITRAEATTDISSILRRMVVKRKGSLVPSHLHRIPPHISNLSSSLPGILSFPMRFNASSPGLVLEYLRSYQNYGDAVLWITRTTTNNSWVETATKDAKGVKGGVPSSSSSSLSAHVADTPSLKETAEAALAVAWENQKFASVCKHEHAQEKRGSPRRVHRSADCSLINSGSWDDPSIVEGRWEDRSSQLASEVRSGGLLLEQDVGVPGNVWRATLNPVAYFFSPPPPAKLRRTKPKAALESGVVDGYVHIMMVPWSQNKGTKFKVSGIMSC